MKNSNKTLLICLVVAIIIIILVMVGVSYHPSASQPTQTATSSVSTNTNSSTTHPPATQEPLPLPGPTQVSTNGWKTYTNNQYGFQISYPTTFSFQGVVQSSANDNPREFTVQVGLPPVQNAPVQNEAFISVNVESNSTTNNCLANKTINSFYTFPALPSSYVLANTVFTKYTDYSQSALNGAIPHGDYYTHTLGYHYLDVTHNECYNISLINEGLAPSNDQQENQDVALFLQVLTTFKFLSL